MPTECMSARETIIGSPSLNAFIVTIREALRVQKRRMLELPRPRSVSQTCRLAFAV